jgi:hypothetical protein
MGPLSSSPATHPPTSLGLDAQRERGRKEA